MKWWTYGRTDGRSRDNPNFSRLQVIISLSHGAPLRASRARELRYYTIKKKKTRRFWKRHKTLSVLGFFNEIHSYQNRETRSTIAFIRADGVHTALKCGEFVTLCNTFIDTFITQTTLHVSDKPYLQTR